MRERTGGRSCSDRALLDQAITGDQKAIQDLTEGELPALTRYIQRFLDRRGLDTLAMEAQVPLGMEKTLQAGFEKLHRKPEKMTLQGWLARHARQVIKRVPSNKGRRWSGHSRESPNAEKR